MQVPQALADRLEDIDQRCEAAERKVHEAQTTLDILLAKRNELEAAIEIIERHAPAPPDVAVPERVSISEYVDARAPTSINPPESTRQRRRNIKELVVEHLQDKPYGDTVKNIASAIRAQGVQIEKHLAELAAEERVESSAGGSWRLCVGIPSVEEGFAPAEEEDRADRPAVFEAADIISFLNARPEGASLAEIEKHGLSVKEALEFGEVWQDARGYYHATAREPGEIAAE